MGNATIGLSGGDAGGIGPNQELIDTPHDQLGADWTDDQFEADSPAAELPDEPIDPDTYEKPLILLDEVRAQGAPDLVGDHGFQPIIVLYPPTLWGLDAPIDEPDEERFELIGSQLPDGSLVCLDIEHWETSAARAPIEEVERSIDKLIASVEAVRRGNPTLKIGIYSMIPVREWHVPQWMYWREIPNQTVYNWHDYWDERVQQWDEDNERLQRLASHVDVIFPSLYTFDNDIEAWTRYARANMEEARRYGKPVYPFIWTRFTYTAINNNAGQPIPADLWQHQIRLLHLIADGVVIWNSLSDTWDPDAEWWSATQAYQQEIEDNPLIYWGD